MKIYLFLIMLLLISPVMAAEWDNRLTYEDDDMTGVITNLFGLGKEIGRVTLKSHDNPTQIRHVMLGKDRVVMYYDFKFDEIYQDGLGDVSFTNSRTGKEIEKDYHFVKEVYTYRTVNDYEDVCGDVYNDVNETWDNVCVKNKTGTHEVKQGNWEKIGNDVPKGDIRIGLVTDVNNRDYIDGVWKIAGVSISKHAEWDSGLEVGLVAYYNLNDSTDNVGGKNNFTNFDGTVVYDDTDCLIGKCAQITTVDNLGLPQTPYMNTSMTYTLNFWARYTSASDVLAGYLGIDNEGAILGHDVSEVYFQRDSWTGTTVEQGAPTLFNQWYMFTIVQDFSNNNVTWYHNGTQVNKMGFAGGSGTGGSTNAMYDTWTFGTLHAYSNREMVGQFDEISFYNRTLSGAEIDQLFNNNAGLTRPPPISTAIDLTYPTNTTYLAEQTVMNYTQVGHAHCWYSLDEGATNSTPVVAGINFTGLLSGGGSSTWTTYCNDTANVVLYDSVTFFVDLDVETHLKAPINDTNTTNALIQFEVNASTVGSARLRNQTIYIYYSNSTLLTTNYSAISGQTSSRKFNYTFAQDGNYIWNAFTEGNSSSTYLSDWDVNRTIFIDTTSPIINITFPTKQIEFGKVGDVIELNYTIIETNPSSCYYVFNGSNHTITCGVNGTLVINDRNFTAQVRANDTLGNIGFDTRTWAFSLLEVSQTFSTNILEGSINEFRLNVSYLSSNFSNIQAFIYYNSTKYEGVQSAGTDSVEFSRNISAVVVVAKNNVSFYWEVILTNGTGAFPFNMSSQNQSVNNINVDLCTSHSVLFINYSLKDEESQAFLSVPASNSSVQFSLQMYPIGSNEAVINFSSNFSNNNNPKICIENDLGDASYTIDLVTSYTALDYVIEHNFIQNATITNSSLPQNIDLLDLLTADSTEFLITFKDTSFLLVADALIDIQRKYLDEGLFKTVEIQKTDENGNAVGHFDTDGVLYTIIVTKFGEILGIFNNIAVICQDAIIGDCDINLKAQATITPLGDLEDIGNLSYTMVFDKDARTITTIFSTTDGSIKTVSINTTKYDRFSNETVCSQQITGSSGTLVCTIPASFGNATVITKLFVGTSPMTQLIQKVFTIPINVFQQFGDDMGALVIIMMLTIPFMAITSTIGFLISIVIGLVMASLLMVFSTSTIIGIGSSLVWLIIAVGILIYKIARRQTL